jgi:hypothetical protein
MSSILRSAVVSMSFCPQQPHMLVSSFQRGGLALWNLSTSSLDAVIATSGGRPGRLVDAHFHPWMPLILTLTERGDVSAWHVSAHPRQAELQKSRMLLPCNLARLEQAYCRRHLPYLPPPALAGHSKLLLHPAHNLCTVLTARRAAPAGYCADAAAHQLLFALADPLCPYSLSPAATVCVCPTGLLERDSREAGPAHGLPALADDSDSVYFVRGGRVACMSASDPDARPALVATLPEVDVHGRALRPLHLTHSARLPLVAVAMRAADGPGPRPAGGGEGAWRVAVLEVGRRECDGDGDGDGDEEEDGRQLFFLGIGAPARPQPSRLSAPPARAERGGAGDRWSAVVEGRDAVFARERAVLLLVWESGGGVSVLALPDSPDPPHVAAWQVCRPPARRSDASARP